MKPILIVLVIAAAGFGAYIFMSQPDEVPNIMMKSSDGSTVDLNVMSEGKNELLLIFLLDRCPISKFSLDLVKGQYPNYSANVAFTGLYFGNQAAAEKFKSDRQVPFPVYGIQDATDPYAINELIETVGSSHGMRDAVYGGTIVCVNNEHKVVFKLEKDEIKQLPEKLSDLGY